MTNEYPLKVKKTKRAMHPNSLANLITYPKGVSGNEGSGKGYSLTAELKHALDKETRQKIIQSTIEGAIARESTPFRELWDRVDGRLQDSPPTTAPVFVVFQIGRGYSEAIEETIEGEVVKDD